MENTNQIFLYLNRGLQTFINDLLTREEEPRNIKKDMEVLCYEILNERNIPVKSHIVTLVNNRIQQYLKIYNLKRHGR